jgi:hypothetical protein
VVKVLHKSIYLLYDKSLTLPAAKRVLRVLHKSLSRPFSQQAQKLMDFSTLKLCHAKTAYMMAKIKLI